MGEILRVGEPPIVVRLRRNARARRMVLRVPKPGHDPTLTLPRHASVASGIAFLRDQDEWLRGHLSRIEPAVRVALGTTLPFRGGHLTVVTGARLARDGDRLFVPARIEPGEGAARYFRESARRICTDTAAIHADRLGRPLGRITLRDTRSRWGSCSVSGDLMFSWRLVMAPTFVLDYVIAHEAAHLVEMNHSPRFWALARTLCPEIDAARLWLRRHGAELHAYDFSSAAPAA